MQKHKTRLLGLGLALAATGGLGQAQAQTTVKVYGKLYPFVVHDSGSGATAPGTRVSSLTRASNVTGTNAIEGTTGMVAGNSRLGFSGTEDLGGGLKAEFQLETQVNVDDGTADATFWARNTFVGLSGGFGTLRLGKMDTIFKEYGDVVGGLGVSSGTFLSSSSVLRKSGFGTSSSSSFHLRRNNSIQYTTPSFGGVEAGFQYSSNEAKANGIDPRVISMGVKYEEGPLYLALAHERHDDLFGGSSNAPRSNAGVAGVNSRDQATQATVAYSFGKVHRVGVDVIHKRYKENAVAAGAFRAYSNLAYQVVLDSRWTDRLRTSMSIVRAEAGSCSLVGASCSTEGLGATKFLVGASYSLSKRTYFFGAVNHLANGKSARYSSTEMGARPNPGEDITQVAIGLAHSF